LSTALVAPAARAQKPEADPKPQGSESHLGREENKPEQPEEEGSESHLGREEQLDEAAPAGEAAPTVNESLTSVREQVYAVSTVAHGPRNWLTLTLQQDFAWLGSEDDACTGQSRAVTCLDANGERIDPALVTTPSGRFDGGFKPSTTRLLLGYERILGSGFALGARAGFVLLGAPDAPGSSDWLRLHLEGRASYFLGGAGYYRNTLRPFVTVGGGFARLSASSRTTLSISGTSASAEAHKSAGPGFAFIGAGTEVALSRQHALRFELRAAVHGGDLGMSLSGGLGYDFGF
jgi:hypothetical protein